MNEPWFIATESFGPSDGDKWSKYIPELIGEDDSSFPLVLPNWDNTPRSGTRGSVYHGSTPATFGEQVRIALDLVAERSPEHRVIFVQAWNEWAEGNYLEPDRRFGRGYLEALRDALLDDGLGTSDGTTAP